jgi:hypothetical protein
MGQFNPTFSENYLNSNQCVCFEDAKYCKTIRIGLYRMYDLQAFVNSSTRTKQPTLKCLDEDFETASQLIESLFKHNILMFENLPRNRKTKKMDLSKKDKVKIIL